MDNPLEVYATVLTTGFVSYLVLHLYGSTSILLSIALLGFVPAVMGRFIFPFHNTLVAFSMASASYWSLLALFATVYRLSPFHPLAKYPGPVLNRISKAQLFREGLKGNHYRYRQQLHHKYGDIVRIGPNDISYANVDGVQAVIGPTGLPKGPFYYTGTSQPSLVTILNPSDYGPRRRLWNKGFSSTSLKHYEEHILKRSRELIDQLGQHKSEKFDISMWMDFFAFDAMGDTVFSTSFDLMKQGRDKLGFREKLFASVRLGYCVSQVIWLNKFVRIFINPDRAVRGLAENMVGDRLKAGSTSEDIFYHLSQNDTDEQQNASKDIMVNEGIVGIVAGSDTTSTALANLWYFFLRHPSNYTRLRQEVDKVFPSGEEPIDQLKLAGMPFLNACLNEAMRLLHPVAGGSQREVPFGSGGKMVGSCYIPEGTNIIIQPYSLQRDPRYFSPYPTTFWPDRWLDSGDRKSLNDASKPFDKDIEVVTNMTAFLPFSTGTRNCPGKNLAMMELRIVASYIVQRFDMRAAEGYNLDDWERDMQDYFVMERGALPVVLTARV